MLQYVRELPSFGTVAANANHSILAPTGPTYRTIILEPTITGVAATVAQSNTQITMTRLRINAVSRFEISADALQDTNAYYGYSNVNGYVPIHLAPSWARTYPGFENLSWGTRNVDTFNIEFTLGAGATINGCKAYALVTPEARDLGTIIEARTLTFAPASVGTYEPPSLPQGNGSLLAMHLENGTGTLTRADIRMNNVEFQSVPDNITKNLQTWLGKRTPQTGYIHIDPIAYTLMMEDRWVIDRQLVTDLRLITTVGVAGTFNAHMFTVNTPLVPVAVG